MIRTANENADQSAMGKNEPTPLSHTAELNMYFIGTRRLIRLADTVPTSTINLRFGAKLRKLGLPFQIPVFCYIKVGVSGVYFTLTCLSDETHSQRECRSERHGEE